MLPLLYIIFCLGLVSATLPNAYQTWRFVEDHNNFRMNVNPPANYMPALYSSATLATSSNAWANQCIWAHSGTPNVGENLYATTVRTPNPNNFNPDMAVNAWGNEKIYYNYTTNACAPNQICGHYTQVVWANTLNVGCAFQDCPTIQNLQWPNGGTIVVCQYSPPGNYVGQKPYTLANWTVNWSQFTNKPFKDISFRGGDFWALDNTNIYRLQNGTFVIKGSTFNSIGATPDVRPWATVNGLIYRYTGSTWQQMPLPSGVSGVIQIDANNVNTAVVTDNQNNAWYFTNNNWILLYGLKIKWISIGYGYDFWALDLAGNSWRWSYTQNKWIQIPGTGFANIHVTDLQNIVAATNNQTLWRFQQGQWTQVPGTSKRLIMSNGVMFALADFGVTYKSP